MSQEDVHTIICDMHVAIGSDGSAFSLQDTQGLPSPHPRNIATFPRFLQTVREHRLMSLQDAVYKMTALPAAIFGGFVTGEPWSQARLLTSLCSIMSPSVTNVLSPIPWSPRPALSMSW